MGSAANAVQDVRIGIIGGGLMGRELAMVCGRWLHLVDHPARPRVTAVADPNPLALDWFRQVSGISTFTADWRDLVANANIDLLYIAVPHHLHEEIYLAAVAAGKDFLGEKPFGFDVSAASSIVTALADSSAFVRVSSEMPFFPGAQRCYEIAASGALGEIVEVRSGFCHSSDIDRSKVINWKRQQATCGEIGVMGDLGMHVAHLPIRLGWVPTDVYALLDNIVTQRPSPAGLVECDTWDNALLVMRTPEPGGFRDFSMIWETRRIAPGQMNTWSFEALGMEAGVRFTTRTPATYEHFTLIEGKQVWQVIQPGNISVWPVISGANFEFGFADALLQMWASFLAERAGALGARFGTATPQEALTSHRVFDGALRSVRSRAASIW